MSQPFLSIVIPTRNRQHYCIAAIENILSYDYPDLELCVHDNSDDDHIQQYLQSRTPDPRLTYKRIAEQLNSVDNMDRAIGMATGHYVCMIGDDDTILPHIFEVTEWMDAHSIDSVCTNQRVQYYWPGAHPDDLSGLLRITTPPVQKMFDWPIEKKLDRLFHQGITRFKIYRLPQGYHGVILGRRLQEIRERTGHYFGGLSPDIYSTMALCGIVKHHIIIDKAVTIAGACSASATARNINHRHRGELSSAPHLRLRGDYKWDEYIPAYYSVETIWAESAMKAVSEMGMNDLRDKFNYGYLAAFAAMNNRNIYKLAMDKSLSKENYFVANDPWIKPKIAANALQVGYAYTIRKLKRKLKWKSDDVQTYYGIGDIAQAVRQYTETESNQQGKA